MVMAWTLELVDVTVGHHIDSAMARDLAVRGKLVRGTANVLVGVSSERDERKGYDRLVAQVSDPHLFGPRRP
jgi:hypothetical protein